MRDRRRRALVLHANPCRRRCSPRGTPTAGLLERIGEVAAALDVPVLVKEVGWGLLETRRAPLAEAGVAVA